MNYVSLPPGGAQVLVSIFKLFLNSENGGHRHLFTPFTNFMVVFVLP